MLIAGRSVGQGFPCFVIAEAGVNHNGDFALACRLVDAAADAGADAVKFQTFSAEQVIAESAPKAQYQLQTTSTAESQLDMARRLELKPEAFHALADRCRQRGIMFLSTPFDEGSVFVLRDCGVPAYKIPSGELTNVPLVVTIARQGLPLIISTGMANLDEVQACLAVVHECGNDQIALLHCVSNYPANPADVNLRAMATLRETFGVPVGYSDHTLGIDVAGAAVALGASILEKHFTLDRSLLGPDHRMSLDPQELRAMVSAIRTIEAALGNGIKRPAASEADVRAVARRSIVARRGLPAGMKLSTADLALKRPGTGLPASALPQIVGRTTRRALARDELLDWSALADD